AGRSVRRSRAGAPPRGRCRPPPLRTAAEVPQAMKVRAVFVDTGAWVALRYKRDALHGRARTLLKRLRKQHVELITTDHVLGETVTLLKARGAVEHAIALGAGL